MYSFEIGFVGWRLAVIQVGYCKPSQPSDSFFIRTLKIKYTNIKIIINSLFLEYKVVEG